MKKILLTVCALATLSTYGQEVLSAAGDHISNADYSLSYTLGELAIETESDDFILTQGFHQTLLTITSISENDAMQVAFYPNPTENTIYLQSSEQHGLTSVELFDMQGRQVKVFNLSGAQQSSISIGDLPSGSYLLVLASPDSNQSSYSALIQKL